jgi:hypothetical protein
MARAFKQGKYKPQNPKKYIGDPTDIVYRSSWEMRLMKKFDESENVLAWSSESVIIPYFSPVDNKMHRYFMDFLVVAKGPNDTKVVSLIEVKPYAQTLPPKVSKGRKKQTIINETMTYLVNQAKWKAAEEYCRKKGWHFKVVTEKELPQFVGASK